MCVRTIIDTNMFGELLSDPVRPLLRWIERKDGVLVYPDGGKYHDELRRRGFSIHNIEQPQRPRGEGRDQEPKRSATIRRLLRNYRQRGYITRIRRSHVAVEDERVAARNLRSDDSHIIALARASDALVLCTNDTDLKEDFTNSKLVPGVGGAARAVYPLPRPPDQRSGLGPGRQIEQTQRDFLDHRKCAGRQRR